MLQEFTGRQDERAPQSLPSDVQAHGRPEGPLLRGVTRSTGINTIRLAMLRANLGEPRCSSSQAIHGRSERPRSVS